MNIPAWETYYRPGNANALRFQIGGLSIWFSYKTPIAFALNGKRVVRQNDWSQTTGRHLNTIDGGAKESRIPGSEFERQLQEALASHGLE